MHESVDYDSNGVSLKDENHIAKIVGDGSIDEG